MKHEISTFICAAERGPYLGVDDTRSASSTPLSTLGVGLVIDIEGSIIYSWEIGEGEETDTGGKIV